MKLFDIQEPGSSGIEEENKKFAVGIDLGTTNSLIAYQDENGVRILGDIVPSIVENISSIKRLMGKSSSEISNPHIVIDRERSELAIKIEDQSYTPEELSSKILLKLKKQGEEILKQEIKDVVITVPAYFDDAARGATKNAAKLAGLNVLRLLNEPTSAALAYGLDKNAVGTYLIYDLGGGTFDVSILKMQQGILQVIATLGDTALGGDDIDHNIASYISTKYRVSISKDLLLVARHIKEALSDKDVITTNFGDIEIRLPKVALEDLAKPLIDKTINIIAKALIDAEMSKDELTGIVLVGGSTKMPFVKQQVEKYLGRAALSDIDPDRVVALGAGILARTLSSGSGNLLLDVNPLSLGIETYGGLNEKVIYRNTQVPFSSKQEFTTSKDNQTGIKLHILQGERELAKDCRSLARFELASLPPMPAGALKLEVTFTIDADGILTVSAIEKITGKVQEVTIKPSYGLDEKQIEKMLYESFEHADIDHINRLLLEAKTAAEQSLYSITQALKEDQHLLTLEQKTKIEEAKEELEKALRTGDRELINQKLELLEAASIDFVTLRVNKYVGGSLTGTRI